MVNRIRELWATWRDGRFWNKTRVYYDPRTNQFVQVRQRGYELHLCGGFCEYYGSAMTTNTTQLLSEEYLQGCEPVMAVDLCTHAQYDGIGWKTV